MPAFDLQVQDFVPTMEFKIDPVAEPVAKPKEAEVSKVELPPVSKEGDKKAKKKKVVKIDPSVE